MENSMMPMQCDKRQMAALQETQAKGKNECQMYYYVTLIVTVEQEKAIVDLFKQKDWVYVRTGQGLILSDLQGLGDQVSGESCISQNSDRVLESHIDTGAQQEYNTCEISGEKGGLLDDDMPTENEVLPTGDNSYIEIKKEKDIEHDESSLTEGLTEAIKEKSCTFSASAALCALSKIATDIPGVTGSNIGDKGSKDSDNPILMSSLAKPKMAEQNTIHKAKPNQDIGTLASTGIASFETSKLGFHCEDCERFFASKMDFDNHATFGKCQWVCKFCKKTFVNNKAKHTGYSYKRFQKALKKHKKECDCICKLCGYSSSGNYNVLRHMETRHSTAKPYTCDVCFFTFESEILVHAHKIDKHTGKADIYHCPLCPEEYPILESLNEHFKCSHLSKKRDVVACSVCGKMMDIYTVKRHEDSHKIKDLKCDQCPAVFNSEHNLRQHQRRHNKEYSHFCDLCGKGFYTITAQVNHRRIHTGEKPFSCSLCQYSCNVKVNLDKHMKLHEKRSKSDQQKSEKTA